MDAPTDRRPQEDADDALAPMQPAPVGMPYTVLFPDGEDYASACTDIYARLIRERLGT